jgi:hypothetical protein
MEIGCHWKILKSGTAILTYYHSSQRLFVRGHMGERIACEKSKLKPPTIFFNLPDPDCNQILLIWGCAARLLYQSIE